MSLGVKDINHLRLKPGLPFHPVLLCSVYSTQPPVMECRHSYNTQL